jgi:hypothetical protein
VRTSSLTVRITAWYDWLLIILTLVFGAYTCKCLDYSLSVGVQNALSIRAREISTILATSGQIPARRGPTERGSNDPFAAVHQRVDSGAEFCGRPEIHMVISGHVPREPKPANVILRRVQGAGFLIATARSRFGSKEYNVEVSTPEKPIKAVFHQAAIRMVLGLVIGLVLATVGSLFIARRALAPVQKIALALQALPVVQPAESGREIAVLEKIECLCVTVNEMFGRLEDSFQIGTGLPAEALHAPGNRLGALRGELANMFENERQSIGMTGTLSCLLMESERLSGISRSLATPSSEPARQTRTERLRFYLGGLAVTGLERICVLTTELAAELTSEARDPSNKDRLVQW